MRGEAAGGKPLRAGADGTGWLWKTVREMETLMRRPSVKKTKGFGGGL